MAREFPVPLSDGASPSGVAGICGTPWYPGKVDDDPIVIGVDDEPIVVPGVDDAIYPSSILKGCCISSMGG